jgi:[protein-PII] uridylyltransferase
LFADTTAILGQLALDILGARIDTTTHDLSINSYFILEEDGSPLSEERKREVEAYVVRGLVEHTEVSTMPPRTIPRRLRAFSFPTEIEFVQNETHRVTELTLVTPDRPGLLSLVGSVLADQELRLRNARVVTEGAVAHDRFTLTDRRDRPVLEPDRLAHLKEALIDKLSAGR